MSRLTRIAGGTSDGLWAVEHDMFALGLHFPGRMVVAGLPSGGLWLWSPVPIDDALAAELAELGPVEWLVAPNRFHHVHLAGVMARYPNARLLGAPGLPDKRKDLVFAGTLGDSPPPEWGGIFEQVVLRGIPSLNEVVFLHRPTRSLVTADLFMNVHRARGILSRLVYRAEGCWRRPRVPRLLNLLLKDRATMRSDAARMAAWAPDRVLLAHGEPVEPATPFVADELTRAFGPLAPAPSQTAEVARGVAK